MKYATFIIAALLLITWCMGLFMFEWTAIIHTLPMLAIILIIMGVIQANMGPKNYTRHPGIEKNVNIIIVEPQKSRSLVRPDSK